MPNYSGIWTPTQQMQAVGAKNWPGVVVNSFYGWGTNSYGIIGNNSTLSSTTPVESLFDQEILKFSGTRGYHTGAVTSNGTLWAWGYNGQGQLGQNDTVDRSSPVQVGALTTWADVKFGYTMTVAIKTDGTLWAWGFNGNGELGQNDTVSRSSPVQVGSLTTWSGVGVAPNTVAAVKTDGTLWTWGRNAAGAIGDNTTISKSSPIQVGALTNWSGKIAGSLYESFSAVKTDGTLWGWGTNPNGSLGINSTTYRSSPTQVGALTNWRMAAAGNYHGIAVKTNNTLWALGGINSFGPLGTGNAMDYSSPVQIGSGTDWSDVSAGYYTSAAIKTDGTIWMWGYGANGRLGNGETVNKSSPIQVGTDTWEGISCGTSTNFAFKKTTIT